VNKKHHRVAIHSNAINAKNMRKQIFILLVASILACIPTGLSAQDAPFWGINYQGVAYDSEGQLMADQRLRVRLSFVSKSNSESRAHFSEVHELQTDDLGIFRFIIGKGNAVGNNTLQEVPWATETIWLNLEISGRDQSAFNLVSSSELQSVPYAFYAETTNELVDDPLITLRSAPSIYWTIGGNAQTRPPYHFIGTRDEQDLVVKTNNETRMVLTAGGQMQILAGVTGGEGNYNAYPLTVQGSNQGIYIKVNGGRSSANNFMTFADGGVPGAPEATAGTKWGEIEGQTVGELLSSFEYIFTNAVFVIDGIGLVATGIGNGAEAAGEAAAGGAAIATIVLAWAAPGFFTAAGADIAKSIALAADAIALAAQAIEYNTNAIASVGVSYSSGAGDYAEWLPRMEGEPDLAYGEIVGIHAGKVSRTTKGADHYKVVSLRPGVLGNAPIDEEEYLYEKIAFLGQVPVRVSGPVNEGDFIVPSGKNDGFGVAVHPDELPTGDFHKIVGVAWEAAPDRPVNTVLIAVGLHKNRLSGRVQEVENKVDRITAYLKGEGPLHPEGDNRFKQPNIMDNPIDIDRPMEDLLSDELFNEFLQKEEARIIETFRLTEKALRDKGYDFTNNPELLEMLHNPIETIKKLRSDSTYNPYWKSVEQKIKQLQTSAGS